MSTFNTKTLKSKIVTNNLAGGEAYKQTDQLELVSLLLTSFVQDTYYEKASSQLDRLKALINSVDPEFAAKAIVYARQEFGMRSITHAAATYLAPRLSGKSYAKKFYEAMVARPDDITETLAFYLSMNKEGKLPNSMIKGFGAAFSKFGGYQLAKYRAEGKSVTLKDAMALTHPVPTERNAEALRLLKSGELKSTDTWESKLSAAGSNAAEKGMAWEELLKENKLGYFALLRNLRNIGAQSKTSLDLALSQLKDKRKIKNSKVLPFRFQTAYKQLLSEGADRKVLAAIDYAADIALGNVPKLEGRTLVALDVSGSMSSVPYRKHGKGVAPAEIGALFAAALVLANEDAELLTFDGSYRWHTVEKMGILPFARHIKTPGGSTDFNQIFKPLTKKYDRIIILSDMQAWVGYHTPKASLEEYKKRTGANPHIWSFDLNGHGTMQFPESNVYALAGFSEKVFDIMPLLEADRKALVNTIKAYDFTSKVTSIKEEDTSEEA